MASGAPLAEFVGKRDGYVGIPVGIFQERTFYCLQIGKRTIHMVGKHLRHSEFHSQIKAFTKLIFQPEPHGDVKTEIILPLA